MTGPGDLRFFGQAAILRKPSPRGMTLVAGAGLALPTGPTRADPLVGPTDATLQLGSGLVSPLGAAAAAIDVGGSDRGAADLSAIVPTYENSHGYRPGWAVAGTAAYERALGARILAAAGGYGSLRGRDQRRGFDITNSGRRTAGLLLRLGVRLPARLAWL